VDYKKWDKFVADVSDDESDDTGRGNIPQVTKFDKEGGETIEIGKSGYSVLSSQHSGLQSTSTTPTNVTPAVINTKNEKTSSEMETLNGGNCGDYYWSQDRYEVRVSVPLFDSSIRGKDLTVIVDGKFLKIIGSGDLIILEKELQFDIEKTSDEPSSGIDWEILSKKTKSDEIAKRYLQLVMKKKCPIPGAFFWWKNVFVGDPEIDVTKIAGRTVASDSTMDAWKNAHDKFAASVAKREKVEVDF